MMKGNWGKVSKWTLALVATLGIACRGERASEDTGGGAGVEVTTQALTAVDVDRVLGFEATTVSDWSIIQSGPGTLSISTTASQGSRSLAVKSHGYVPLQSVALTSLGSRVGSLIHYDIMLPSELKQISPKNYGATQLYLNSTSLGLNNTYLGQVDLTPLPLGQWNTVTFTPSSSLLTKLRGTYTDLRVTIVVNAPYNATQPYLLDNLRFSDSTLALVTVVDGAGHPLSGLTVTAYNGSTPTSNTGATDSTGLAKLFVPPGSYRFGVTEAGVTTYSSPTNQCQVPGMCAAATIIAKCHGIVCTAKDQCHSVGLCDPNAGLCSNPNKTDGSACNDANACTKDDVCTAGVCGGTAYTCNDGLACTADSCKGDGTCTFNVTAGNCLVDGACYASGAGSPTGQCQQCTPTTSQAAWSPKADGSACNDGDFLTTNDVCQSGGCRGTAIHGSQQLSGQTLPSQLGAPPVGPVPGSTVITLAINLQLQNPTSDQDLQNLAQQVSDPDSTTYRHYKSADDFAAQFGALPIDYQHVQDWATSHGLTVTKTFANNLLVVVSGTAQAVQQALYTHLNYYSRPDGTQFYGPDRQPSVDPAGSPLPIFYIENLDNMAVPMRANAFLASLPNSAYPSPFKNSGGLFVGDDFRNAYAYDASTHAPTTLTGAGQCVGLVMEEGYSLADLQQYWTNTGRTYNMPRITAVDDGTRPACSMHNTSTVACDKMVPCGTTTCNVTCGTATCVDPTSHVDYCAQLNLPSYEAVCGVDFPTLSPGKTAADLKTCYVSCPTGSGCGSSSPPNATYGGNLGSYTGAACAGQPDPGEIEPDIEMVLAMAPGADIVTYSGAGTTVVLTEAALQNPPCYQLSTSWGMYDNNNAAQNIAVDRVVAELVLQGQAFFHGSGDWGTSIWDHVTSPWITEVGETLLWTDSSGLYSFELPHPASGGYTMDGTFTAGCDSSVPVAIPWYQLGVGSLASQGYRNVPDVSMVGYSIEVASVGLQSRLQSGGFNQGTSLSSPLWAAYWALANQQSLSNGRGPIGTANPVLYAIGKTRGTTADVYKTSFNDITKDLNDPDDGVDTFVSVRGPNGNCPSASDSDSVAFAAGDGYDLATGWGSPKLGLIAQLASTSPAPVSTIAAGDFHACAVRSGGTVSCWGLNNHGQLGNGSKIDSNTAQTALNLTKVWQVSAGGYHTCAVTKGGYQVYCWGGSDAGQLGLGYHITTDQTSPVLVGGLTSVMQIAAGYRHTCAILGPPPVTLMCWGDNTNGQIGDGTTTSRSDPTLVVLPSTSPPAQVALGRSHTCVLLADGTVACWGANSHGQLGIDSTTEKHTPQVVTLPPAGLSATMLAVGANHTCINASYGTSGDSEILCWGDNSLQQLGTGPETQQLTPTEVRYWGLSPMGFAGLAAGGNHTCALQLDRGTPGGKVAGCWGDNSFGQLGIGNTTSPGGVIALYSLANVATIVAGNTSTYVLTTAGAVGAWGDNGHGQLGDKSNVQQNSPEMITLF